MRHQNIGKLQLFSKRGGIHKQTPYRYTYFLIEPLVFQIFRQVETPLFFQRLRVSFDFAQDQQLSTKCATIRHNRPHSFYCLCLATISNHINYSFHEIIGLFSRATTKWQVLLGYFPIQSMMSQKSLLKTSLSQYLHTPILPSYLSSPSASLC